MYSYLCWRQAWLPGPRKLERPKPINLIDQRGRTVTQKDFIGKPSLIFFGFTPRSARLPWQRSRPAWRLGPLAERLNVIFVTADPERDTPEILREYLGSFDRSSD